MNIALYNTRLRLFNGRVLLTSTPVVNVYYVTTTGVDDAGRDGSYTEPWTSITYAASRVTEGTIFVKQGTYTTTSQCNLPVNVNLIGEGTTKTIIKSTLTHDSLAILNLASVAEGTNGNQSIIGIKFDGDNLTTAMPAWVFARSNVHFHHSEFVDFRRNGVLFYGKVDGSTGAPTVFATGNKIFDNVFTNCAGFYTSFGGNINFGGQDGLLIYNNLITQTARTTGNNGCGIKGLLGRGYSKNVKIYNNEVYCDPTAIAPNHSFAIELWTSLGGIEVYNNIVNGNVLDLGGDANIKGDSTYSYSVHHNWIGCSTLMNIKKLGMVLEASVNLSDVLIYNNHFKNLNRAIVFYPLDNTSFENWLIAYNLFEEIGIDLDGWNDTKAIGTSANEHTFTASNWKIFNNNFLATTRANTSTTTAFTLPNTINSTISGIYVKNNIFVGWDLDFMQTRDNAGTITDLEIMNNVTFQNGNSNDPRLYSVNLPDYVNSGNIKADPLFISSSDYRLQAGSPAINAGLDVGLLKDFDDVDVSTPPEIGIYEY